MSLRIHHLALRTRDPAGLARFYTSVLGLIVARRDDARSTVWLETGSAVLMIEPAQDGEPLPDRASLDLVAFAIDPTSALPDLDAWRRHLGACDVLVEASTGFTLYFRDPDGRRVGVSAFDLLAAADREREI